MDRPPVGGRPELAPIFAGAHCLPTIGAFLAIDGPLKRVEITA